MVTPGGISGRELSPHHQIIIRNSWDEYLNPQERGLCHVLDTPPGFSQISGVDLKEVLNV